MCAKFLAKKCDKVLGIARQHSLTLTFGGIKERYRAFNAHATMQCLLQQSTGFLMRLCATPSLSISSSLPHGHGHVFGERWVIDVIWFYAYTPGQTSASWMFPQS